MFLNGNFVAIDKFKRTYGVIISGSGPTAVYAIPTRWQSSLFQAGQCGAFIGVFLAGPVTNRLGYRWTTLLALVLMNATIFISFFVSSLFPLSVLSLSPDHIHLGQLAHRSCNWTSVRRCPVGIFYCELPCIRQRGCSSRPPRCLYSYSPNELVYRWYHCRRRHLCIQSKTG